MKNDLNQINIKTEPKQVKNINHELVIGGGNLDVFVDAYIDGKLVMHKKSDSMLRGFLNTLYLQMNGLNFTQMPDVYFANDVGGAANNITHFTAVSSVTSGTTGTVVRLNISGGTLRNANPATGWCSIASSQPPENDLKDGMYTYEYKSTSQVDIFLTGTTAATSAGYVASSATIRQAVLSSNPVNLTPSTESFKWPMIVVGTGTKAVDLSDCLLEKELQTGSTSGRLTYGGMTGNDDTTISNQSEISFVRSFTNGSGSAITINEIGMYAVYSSKDNYGYTLMIRDAISPGLEVEDGKILIIIYYIRAVLSTGTNPGGFLQNFMKLLRRQFGQVTRSAINILNADSTWANSTGTFKVLAPGGETQAITYGDVTTISTDPAWKHGVVLGFGTSAVSETDIWLGPTAATESQAFHHGSDSISSLNYYGQFIHNFTAIADTTTAVSFDIVRVVENACGTAVTANEIGLTVGAHNSTGDGSDQEYPVRLFLIARNLLTTPVVIANGEMLKITYTIKVIL
jgi:hypothetical protein